MTDKWHGGKGDRLRKGSNQKAYSDNYDRIFGKRQPQQQQTLPSKEEEQLRKEQAQDPKNG
jgi:hypothetical protein